MGAEVVKKEVEIQSKKEKTINLKDFIKGEIPTNTEIKKYYLNMLLYFQKILEMDWKV